MCCIQYLILILILIKKTMTTVFSKILWRLVQNIFISLTPEVIIHLDAVIILAIRILGFLAFVYILFELVAFMTRKK